mmetsp:Transcript_36638/g.94849  ORF Transcript_36638/g.94849 Transcript_36638/m.94849 type:complete len:235 (-) Transcript_36638:17-721(-)
MVLFSLKRSRKTKIDKNTLAACQPLVDKELRFNENAEFAHGGTSLKVQGEDADEAADDFACVAEQADVLTDAALVAAVAWEGQPERGHQLGVQLGELRRLLRHLSRLRWRAEGAAGGEARHNEIRALTRKVDKAQELFEAAMPPLHLRRRISSTGGLEACSVSTPHFGFPELSPPASPAGQASPLSPLRIAAITPRRRVGRRAHSRSPFRLPMSPWMSAHDELSDAGPHGPVTP